MKKTLKTIALLLLAFCLSFYLFYFQEVNYGLRQAKGQLKVIMNTVPIEEVMADSNFPDSLKAKIELIQEIKKFTVDSLGLKPSTSYLDYYEQHGQPILWVITACPPYKLENKKWKFPIAGEFGYKGHFEKEITQKEVNQLKQEGLDVRVSEVSAWSTLGYLSDPILSSMLERDEGSLAALIIHELTHGTLFVKNDLEFNENLADFVGDHGALLFLQSKYGKGAKEIEKYKASKKFYERFSGHIAYGTEKLDSLFQTFPPEMASIKKDSLKYDLIDEIMLSADSLSQNSKYKYKGRGSINNAFFTAYRTYQGKQSDFENELESKFNNNFKEYLSYLKSKFQSLGR
ncbi:aminopeptidase [Arcticibacterium luteifluviistationis]|uniref:Aminopeptidase n=1 Tax=Arcticibacterium luteifluviistationis TaxID=1784714 RepID=A0A2Z4G8Z1_9BACT|nr:aminopeptidase [Arcticibacterium luteifluviistationis]AWV97575.1 aminopeptidase [Arcticibacterium luteifluviistationis]